MRLRRKSDKTAIQRSVASKRVLENFVPPEGVPIGFELASLGARFGAVLLDLILTWLAILLLILLVAWLGILPKTALFALVVILAFFVSVPYYVLSELIWNGCTLGKRIVGIMVISADSRALGAHQVVARNLLKDIEFLCTLVWFCNGTTPRSRSHGLRRSSFWSGPCSSQSIRSATRVSSGWAMWWREL